MTRPEKFLEQFVLSKKIMDETPNKRGKFVEAQKVLFAMPVRRFRKRPARTYRRRVARTYRRRPARRMPRPELKNVDVNPGVIPLSSAGGTTSLTLLNGLTQGISETQRIGRKVTFTKEMIRLSMKLTDAAGTGPPVDGCVLRVMVVQDRQCNGSPIMLTDLLVTATTTSFNNLEFGKRFYVHKDMRMTFDVDSNSATRNISINLKRRVHTTFGGIGSAISNIATNSLYLILITDTYTSPDVLQVLPQIRLRFADN